MIIKLGPHQIPPFWEAIKQATTAADEIDKRYYPVYLNALLHSLLNDKSQCFIRLSPEKVLLSIMVTKIVEDTMAGTKALHIQTLYSWQMTNEQEWLDDFNLVREFAGIEGCSSILFESRHHRVQEIGRSVGFKEVTRRYFLGV